MGMRVRRLAAEVGEAWHASLCADDARERGTLRRSDADRGTQRARVEFQLEEPIVASHLSPDDVRLFHQDGRLWSGCESRSVDLRGAEIPAGAGALLVCTERCGE